MITWPALTKCELGAGLQGLHTISINTTYRITLELIINEHEIIPIDVGTHDVVY